MALKLKVVLTRSGINRCQDQKDTIRGLGLTRMHQFVILDDTLAIRGMLRKVAHLVNIEPIG
jgi:large subunit ribosomal protein L30